MGLTEPAELVDPSDRGKALRQLWAFLERAVFVPGFFGSVTVRVQNGKMGDVKLDVTKKLHELDDLKL